MSMNRIFFKRMLRKYRREQGIQGPRALFRLGKKPDNAISRAINKSIYGTNDNKTCCKAQSSTTVNIAKANNKKNETLDQRVKDELAEYYKEHELNKLEDKFSLAKLARNLGLILMGFVAIIVWISMSNINPLYIFAYIPIIEAFLIIKTKTASVENRKLWKWTAIYSPIVLVGLIFLIVGAIDGVKTR